MSKLTRQAGLGSLVVVRTIALIVLCALVTACSGRGPVAGANDALVAVERPNIIIIMFDDLSPRIAALGDPVSRTPALDQFAREAVHYPNMFSTSPVCAPSRSALMTGVHQQTLGSMHMRTRGTAGLSGGGPIEYDAVPPSQMKAFPELLRAAGYHTVNIGKFDYQFGEPFTIWDDSGPQADWRRRPAGQPFFAFINLQHTHESYLWPEATGSENRLARAVAERNRRAFVDKQRLTDPASVEVPPYLPDTPVVRQDIARLYDNLSFDDRNVQRIMDALREDGVLDNSIVIITSDHGDGLPRMKRAIHASGLRVPFLVRFPDGRQEQRESLASLVDVAPTVLQWARVPVPTWVQGRALGAAGQRYVFASSDRFDANMERRKSVIDGRYQYIRSYGDEPFFRPLMFRDFLPTMQELWRLRGENQLTPDQAALFEPLPRELLYDLRSDPHAMRNLANSVGHRTHLVRLRAAMNDWLARTPDLSAAGEAAMIADMWPGLVQPVTASPAAYSASDGRVELRSATMGASIGYRLGEGEPWRLYSGPIAVPGRARLSAKAIRYGHQESAEVILTRQP